MAVRADGEAPLRIAITGVATRWFAATGLSLCRSSHFEIIVARR
jgi:hypothetical protein